MLGIMSDSNAKFDPDAQTHINRLSSPSSALKTALNTLVVDLKADGIWDNIYAICVQHNIQGESLYDLKGTQDSTNLAGATWSSTGWSLGTTTGLIDTQVVPTASSGIINVNDNHLMCYLATSLTDDSCYLMGSDSGTQSIVTMRYGVGAAGAMIYIGDAWASSVSAIVIATPSGCCIGSLLSGTSRIRVAASQHSIAITPAAPSTSTNSIYIGQSNGSLGVLPPDPSETFTAWASGGGLTAQQFDDYYTHIQDYMVTMGWEA